MQYALLSQLRLLTRVYGIYIGISKINSMYGNLNGQMKLDLCIYEALSYMSVPWKPYGHGYQLPLISIKPIFENISSRAEQKTTVARYQTCYTNSTQGSIHESIWKTYSLLKYSCKMPKIINIGHYARYRSNTNNKLTLLPESLVFSDCKQSFKP